MGGFKRFLLAMWSAPRFWRYVTIGAILFAISPVGAKASSAVLSVFVTNTPSNPVPVHEQDSTALHPFRAVLCGCLASQHDDQFTVPTGQRLVIQEVTGTTLGPPGGGNLLPGQTDFRLTDTSVTLFPPFNLPREYDFASTGGFFDSGSNTTVYNMSASTTLYADSGAVVQGSDPQQLEWYMTVSGYLISTP